MSFLIDFKHTLFLLTFFYIHMMQMIIFILEMLFIGQDLAGSTMVFLPLPDPYLFCVLKLI